MGSGQTGGMGDVGGVGAMAGGMSGGGTGSGLLHGITTRLLKRDLMHVHEANH